MHTKIFTNIAIIIFLYYLTYYLYTGILQPVPALGDSWDYHIPISNSILNGSFLHPVNVPRPQVYYPGSTEAFNSLLLLLHVPLTISNLLAVIVLFFTLWKLALTFRLKNSFALLFALTFCTLNVIVRWLNAVSIDVWVAVFFCYALILLEKPEKTNRYFLQLGFAFGMLVGSKYMAIAYIIVLSIFYARRLLSIINPLRFLAFVIPFSVFGLFWYMRNYMFVQNPVYPLCMFSMPCVNIFNELVLQMTTIYPRQMFDAVFGEYKLWILAPFAVAGIVVWYAYKRKIKQLPAGFLTLAVLGLANFVIYFFFPTTKYPWIMVSSLRYSYSAFILLILAIFKFAEKYKLEDYMGYFAIANMLSVLTMAYYPKLIFFYLPISALCIYLFNRSEKNGIINAKTLLNKRK